MKKLNIKLVPPCSYQGGKQRLANQIVDIIFEQNEINEDTKFFDLCCGSGAITLELINRGVNPSNITMVDASMWGRLWQSIANNEFELDMFKNEIDKLPEINEINKYLKQINKNNIKKDLDIYHFLLQQAGSFGSKYIDNIGDKWINATFRNYWTPTETSNRRSPVNPMMPMADTLFKRTKAIIDSIGGKINAIHSKIENIEWHFDDNSIVYIDPPYKNTSGYNHNFNYEDFIINNCAYVNIYVSEGYKIYNAEDAVLLSKGRTKGNISGGVKKKPTEEWLNIYKSH